MKYFVMVPVYVQLPPSCDESWHLRQARDRGWHYKQVHVEASDRAGAELLAVTRCITQYEDRIFDGVPTIVTEGKS